MLSLDLKGKIVFVSGGAGDIGSQIVDSFVKQGCETIIGDMDEKNAKDLAAKYPGRRVSVCVSRHYLGGIGKGGRKVCRNSLQQFGCSGKCRRDFM